MICTRWHCLLLLTSLSFTDCHTVCPTSCLPYIHVCPKCPFLWFALHGHFFMVCPTSCLPYIDWWPQNVSFVTSGSPYFMFALSEMSLPYVHVCPTGHVALHGNFFSSKWNICNFWFALLHVCPFWEVIALPSCLPYRKCCPTKCIFFNEFKNFCKICHKCSRYLFVVHNVSFVPMVRIYYS